MCSSDLTVRRAALASSIPYVTTIAAARAMAQALRVLKTQEVEVKAMQDYHPSAKPAVKDESPEVAGVAANV